MTNTTSLFFYALNLTEYAYLKKKKLLEKKLLLVGVQPHEPKFSKKCQKYYN